MRQARRVGGGDGPVLGGPELVACAYGFLASLAYIFLGILDSHCKELQKDNKKKRIEKELIEGEVFYIGVVGLTQLKTHVSGGGSFRRAAASPCGDLLP